MFLRILQCSDLRATNVEAGANSPAISNAPAASCMAALVVLAVPSIQHMFFACCMQIAEVLIRFQMKITECSTHEN